VELAVAEGVGLDLVAHAGHLDEAGGIRGVDRGRDRQLVDRELGHGRPCGGAEVQSRSDYNPPPGSPWIVTEPLSSTGRGPAVGYRIRMSFVGSRRAPRCT